MARRYVWKRGNEWSKPARLTHLMLAAQMNVRMGQGPFTLSQDGDPISGQLSRGDVLARFKKAIVSRDIGPTFRIRKKNGDVVFTSRACEVDLVKVIDSTNGNSHSDFYYTWVVNNFSGFDPRYAGAYVCKYVVGSSTLSQHSYGNAVDFFFDTMAHQDVVAQEVVKVHDLLHAEHVISRDRIWEPEIGWRPYAGEYHSHLHVDFLPQFSGPCGVREP